MGSRIVVLATLVPLLVALGACGSPGSDLTPEAVAEAYLRAGSAENEAEIRANLDPACHSNESMTRVDGVRMMGVPITIETLTVTPGATTEETARVNYEVAGPAHGSGGTQMMFGVEITTGEVNIEQANRGGGLDLRRVDDRWMVTCN